MERQVLSLSQSVLALLPTSPSSLPTPLSPSPPLSHLQCPPPSPHGTVGALCRHYLRRKKTTISQLLTLETCLQSVALFSRPLTMRMMMK